MPGEGPWTVEVAKIGFDVAGEYLEFVGHCLESVMDSRGDLEVTVSD